MVFIDIYGLHFIYIYIMVFIDNGKLSNYISIYEMICHCKFIRSSSCLDVFVSKRP